MKDKKYLWIGIALLIVLIIFARSGSSNDSGATSTEGTEYSISSEDGKLVGKARITSATDDYVSVDYGFLIEDDSIKNNGRCIDEIGSWCASDEDGTRVALEETKYRYGVIFESTLEEEYPSGGALDPIYCNVDEAKANPERLLLNPEDRLDTKCDGWILANWQPTSFFKVSNRSTFDSIEDFLESDLVLFDTSALYTISYETTATSGTLSENAVSFSQFPMEPRIKNYPFSIQ